MLIPENPGRKLKLGELNYEVVYEINVDNNYSCFCYVAAARFRSRKRHRRLGNPADISYKNQPQDFFSVDDNS